MYACHLQMLPYGPVKQFAPVYSDSTSCTILGTFREYVCFVKLSSLLPLLMFVKWTHDAPCVLEAAAMTHLAIVATLLLVSINASLTFPPLQVRLAEIEAERAAKKLAAHKAAEQKLKEAAMPLRMQMAADVSFLPHEADLAASAAPTMLATESDCFLPAVWQCSYDCNATM